MTQHPGSRQRVQSVNIPLLPLLPYAVTELIHVVSVCVYTSVCMHMHVWRSEVNISYLLSHLFIFKDKVSLTKSPRPHQFV